MFLFLSKFISLLFYLLLFFIPIILFPTTSELFEFNKIVTVYFLTTLIVSAWILKMITSKRIIFRRTILDIPLLIFLGSQIISTIVSIDPRTSLLGYYSRFNGGLVSSISYSLLYWAYVSNMDKKTSLKSLYSLLISGILVSIYGVLEHFGIDRSLWVQDVQNRVFSTLGQPNWLAAWLVALIPITWALALNSKENLRYWLWTLISTLFFLTLLYTKSRSGILGFLIADLVFWIGVFFLHFRNKLNLKKIIFSLCVWNLEFGILIFIIGTPWTSQQKPQDAPALETGGTESGEIRKIVWKGAIDIWKHYPIFGTGVETFAFSYYNFRPVEHNLVSEWDFLYNKAHNEYLNYLATSGSVGLISYLLLIFAVIYQFLSSKTNHPKFSFLGFAFLSGFLGILITNFFGFSVVPVSLLFFLYPAFSVAIGITQPPITEKEFKKFDTRQKILALIIISSLLLVVFLIAKYWYADILYAKGKNENASNDPVAAYNYLIQATKLSPHEAIFWDELSQSKASLALALAEGGKKDKALEFAQSSILDSEKALALSPRSLNLRRSTTNLYIKLSELNPSLLKNAEDILTYSITLAPTDAKLVYNLGLIYTREGKIDPGIASLEKAIQLKPNYKNPRQALGLILLDKGLKEEAKKEFTYILENIDPKDTTSLDQLGKIK